MNDPRQYDSLSSLEGLGSSHTLPRQEHQTILKAIERHSIVSITDVAGTILDVNQGFCDISGYSREELIGQNHRIINSGIHPKSFWVGMWRKISAGITWQAEVCNRRKNGNLYWVDSTVVPCLNAEGKPEKVHLHQDRHYQPEAR